jgi:hypothetical protein
MVSGGGGQVSAIRLRIAACDEPLGCELRAERLSRVECGKRKRHVARYGFRVSRQINSKSPDVDA